MFETELSLISVLTVVILKKWAGNVNGFFSKKCTFFEIEAQIYFFSAV